MKIFIDTANIEEIKDAYSLGIVSGVTTNPSIIAKEGKKFEDAIAEISAIVSPETLIFGEVISLEADKMVEEGHKINAIRPNMIVKIPTCKEGLKAVSVLSKEGIKTCCTLCFSAGQALLASNAGALAGFAAGGAVVWALGAPLALASIAGNLLGVRLAVRIGASAVRNFLYLVLAGLLATLIWRFVI